MMYSYPIIREAIWARFPHGHALYHNQLKQTTLLYTGTGMKIAGSSWCQLHAIAQVVKDFIFAQMIRKADEATAK